MILRKISTIYYSVVINSHYYLYRNQVLFLYNDPKKISTNFHTVFCLSVKIQHKWQGRQLIVITIYTCINIMIFYLKMCYLKIGVVNYFSPHLKTKQNNMLLLLSISFVYYVLLITNLALYICTIQIVTII